MSVSLDDVRHIAALARLGLPRDRAEAMAAQLSTILQHMEVLSRADVNAVLEPAADAEPGLPLRPDHGPPIPLQAPLPAFAPAARDGLLLVPRLATHEDPEATS
ncbi:MAG TPA: aspartyl/glutamyl-tRNA amidotransferase subunit C [Gemmatimonadaceae bacterium]|nr:aspartyl/glutamyl-tRNA amidotransferase subunit C [Gemmatimonadaceae bacterium]